MHIRRLAGRYGIYRMPRGAPIRFVDEGFFSLTRTADEVSIICRERHMPHCESSDTGYTLLQLEAAPELPAKNAIADISILLDTLSIPVLAISTHSAHYVLIQHAFLPDAQALLEDAGHMLSPH